MSIEYVLFDLVAVIIEVTMCFVFVMAFIDKNVTKKYVIGIIAANILEIVFNYITVQIKVYSVSKSIVYVGIVLIIQCWVFREYYDRIAVMSITYMLFLTLIDYSTVAIMTYLSRLEFSYFQKMTIFRIYGTLISKMILLTVVILIRKKLTGLKKLQRNYLIALFGISGSILMFAFYLFHNFMKRNYILGSETIMFILLLVIEIMAIFSLNFIIEKKENEKKLSLLNLYNNMLELSLEEEKHSFSMWSRQIHDYKNHVIYMQELLKTKEYEKLEEYMQNETGILKTQSPYVQSGYKGIDAILNSKILYAKSKDIHTVCNITIPKGLSLNEDALVTILGNLLDNAIRAEQSLDYEKKKLIEINMCYMKENIYIKIVNQKGKEMINFEKSDKEEKQWHGIGLKSVREEIKKMNADFRLIQKDENVIAIIVIYDVIKEKDK